MKGIVSTAYNAEKAQIWMIWKKLLTIKDVQEHLQLGRNRVYQLIKLNLFPKIKIGNTYRIPKREYLEWGTE